MNFPFNSEEYPVEVLGDQYLTPIGGFSNELIGNQIGLNKESINKNTDLTAWDKVIIKTFDEKSFPFFLRKYFVVVPLDIYKPDAFLKSPNGEAVFPIDLYEKLMSSLKKERFIILNNAWSKNEREIAKYFSEKLSYS